MKFRNSCFAVLVAGIFAATAAGAEPIKVPFAKQVVMIDGKISPTEWQDAATTYAGDFARIYIKQTKEHVWLTVEFLRSKTGTLDLYISPGRGRPVNLHASAKLGQRILQNGAWPEEWTWWNNDGWVANVSRVDSWDKRSFMPETVREFQIARSWFPNGEFRIMVEMMTPAEPNWQTTAFPADAVNTDPKRWAAFRLD